MRPLLWFTAALALAASGVASSASAQYAIKAFTIGGGGTTAAIGGGYALGGTIGQTDAGTLNGGAYELKGGFWRGGTTLVGVDDGPPVAAAPVAFALHPASPNPLVRSSVVAFDLPREQAVRLRIFDASGRLTRTLADGTLSVGAHRRIWDGNDEGGRRVAAGIYFVRLESESRRASQKLVVLD